MQAGDPWLERRVFQGRAELEGWILSRACRWCTSPEGPFTAVAITREIVHLKSLDAPGGGCTSLMQTVSRLRRVRNWGGSVAQS